MSEFFIGEKVRVLKATYEEDGWRNTWTHDMNDYIGKDYTVCTSTLSGVYFEEDGGRFGFPKASLRRTAIAKIFEKEINRLFCIIREDAIDPHNKIICSLDGNPLNTIGSCEEVYNRFIFLSLENKEEKYSIYRITPFNIN